MRAWAAALLLLAAATAREVVRLGYFTAEILAETRTQKHRRANLPRRTSAFSSRHDDNV